MEEIWKDIRGYEGHYQVSNLGSVKSLYDNGRYGKHYREKILKKHIAGSGYLQACLFNKGKRKWFSIHRLVAQAFIPNPNNLPEVNHKDENPQNNKLINLEWCDRTYNNNYGNRTKKTCKEVKQLDLEGNFIKLWSSTREIYRRLGFSTSSIIEVCNGKHKQAHGFKWVYKIKN